MDTESAGAAAPTLEARRLDALTAIATALARAPDLDAVLSLGLEAVLQTLTLPVGGIYLRDDTGQLQLTRHHRGVPAEYADTVARFAAGEAILGRAATDLAPSVVPDLSAMPEAGEATRRLGLRSFVFVPLYASGRPVGVLTAGAFAERDFPQDELRLLEAVGGMLGGAVQNARLLERAQRHLSLVQALWEIDRAIVEDRELPDVLTVIAREAGRLGGGDAVIALCEDEDRLRVAGTWGERAVQALGDPPALRGTPVATLLLESRPQAVPLAPGRAFVVPLRSSDRTVGGLVVVKDDDDLCEDDLTTLATFGHRTAVALAKARIRDSEGRRARQLALVSAASEIAASTLDLEELLGSLARFIQRSFGHYGVTVYLVEPESREAVLTGAAGAGTLMPKGQRVRFGQGIIGWVAERGRSVFANDVRREPRFRATAMAATLAELAVPVRLTGEVVAVINVEADRVNVFDDGDVTALEGIASQVASAVRNARLFEEKVRALRNLEILQEITNVLNSDLDLDALLHRIARRSVDVVRPAQMGAVLLYDGGALIVRSSHGYASPDCLARVRVGLHDGLPGSVFVTGQGRVVAPGDHGREAEAFREAAGGIDPKSALCVPISLPQEKLGVLLLENFTSPAAFESADLRFAATLAHQAAIAIGNALRLRRILELDQHRQDYLSNVSHELRTPLTVVQGYLEAVVDGGAGEQAPQFLRVALDQCQRLSKMIDEALEISRLERGVAQRHLKLGPVALDAALRKVLQMLRQEALLKELVLSEEVQPGLPPVVADERLLHLLMLNVVENAVKFTPKGGSVRVALKATEDEALLTVADNGIGIAPEHHQRIFEKFFMVEGGRTRSYGGAGIGLYLAREVVAIHQGSITVESTPGQGSRFEVRLPLRPRK